MLHATRGSGLRPRSIRQTPSLQTLCLRPHATCYLWERLPAAMRINRTPAQTAADKKAVSSDEFVSVNGGVANKSK